MLQNMMPEKENSVALMKQLLGYLGFNNAYLLQGIGNVNIICFNLVRQRLKDQCIQNWGSRLERSSRSTFLCICSFQFQVI